MLSLKDFKAVEVEHKSLFGGTNKEYTKSNATGSTIDVDHGDGCMTTSSGTFCP